MDEQILFDQWLAEQAAQESGQGPMQLDDQMVQQLLANMGSGREPMQEMQQMPGGPVGAIRGEPLQEMGQASAQKLPFLDYSSSMQEQGQNNARQAYAQYMGDEGLQELGQENGLMTLLRAIKSMIGGGRRGQMRPAPQQQPNIYPQQPNEGGILDLLNSIRTGAQ